MQFEYSVDACNAEFDVIDAAKDSKLEFKFDIPSAMVAFRLPTMAICGEASKLISPLQKSNNGALAICLSPALFFRHYSVIALAAAQNHKIHNAIIFD